MVPEMLVKMVMILFFLNGSEPIIVEQPYIHLDTCRMTIEHMQEVRSMWKADGVMVTCLYYKGKDA